MAPLRWGVTELHLHLEGSLPARSAVEIAKMRSHPWGMLTPAQLRRRFSYTSFDEFLAAIREMCRVLADPLALERAARELSIELKCHGVEHAEVYTSPYIYVRWGIEYAKVLEAVDRGFAAGEAAGGTNCAILLDSVRQWGADAAHRVLDGLEESRVSRVIGFGLGGEERVGLEAFQEVYDRARSLGLRTVVHAGEGTTAADVWKAIDVLQVDRVAHGIRATEDRLLMRTLAERRIPLDLAVTSNYRTRVVTTAPHPIRQLFDAGVKVNLSTDDPSLFRTSLSREYRRARRYGTMSERELRVVAENGIEASFVGDELKAKLRERLAEVWPEDDRAPSHHSIVRPASENVIL